MPGVVAIAETDIDAPPNRVWEALTDPTQIKQYMFDTDVQTDWTLGSRIVWSGEFNGKAYQDKGEIVAIEPQRLLVLTHFSSMSGREDVPANYHTLTYRLEERDSGTRLSLSQDGNGDADEAAHAQQNWQTMLGQLKKVVEDS